jgi:hypothetical protein
MRKKKGGRVRCDQRGRGDRTFADLSHEAYALPGYGADQPLVLSAVADSFSGRVDAARQRRFRDDPSTPD